MKLKKDIVSFSFRKHLECIRQEQERQAARHLILYTDGQLVQRHENSQSQFGRACITAGYLSPQQVEHATRRYHLGMSRDGGVIFWQIDMLGQVYDGKVMYYRSDCHRDHHHNPTWVGSLLKNFYLKGNKELIASIPSSHCLFGLHLLREEEIGMKEDGRLPTVAVVEAEKTAVIMSEVFPQYLWMATGGCTLPVAPPSRHPVSRHRPFRQDLCRMVCRRTASQPTDGLHRHGQCTARAESHP